MENLHYEQGPLADYDAPCSDSGDADVESIDSNESGSNDEDYVKVSGDEQESSAGQEFEDFESMVNKFFVGARRDFLQISANITHILDTNLDCAPRDIPKVLDQLSEAAKQIAGSFGIDFAQLEVKVECLESQIRDLINEQRDEITALVKSKVKSENKLKAEIAALTLSNKELEEDIKLSMSHHGSMHSRLYSLQTDLRMERERFRQYWNRTQTTLQTAHNNAKVTAFANQSSKDQLKHMYKGRLTIERERRQHAERQLEETRQALSFRDKQLQEQREEFEERTKAASAKSQLQLMELRRTFEGTANDLAREPAQLDNHRNMTVKKDVKGFSSTLDNADNVIYYAGALVLELAVVFGMPIVSILTLAMVLANVKGAWESGRF